MQIFLYFFISNSSYKVIRTVGSSKDSNEIIHLTQKAYKILPTLFNQQVLDFQTEKEEIIDNFMNELSNSSIRSVGSEQIFGKIFDKIGFNQVKDNDLFKDLVLNRLTNPSSKLKLVEYLKRSKNIDISVYSIYRHLDKISNNYKSQIEQIVFAHTKEVLKEITVVFYDMTTIYFEATDEDDLRKIGFSKDGKFKDPQIFLGLLVGEMGYPIGYKIFEGNIYEGHTLLPVINAFKAKFNLKNIIVVADSGLLSNANIEVLKQENYQYILGARIKNETQNIKKQILSLALSKHKTTGEIKISEAERLIVKHSEKRARKDLKNREKGLSRLEKKLSSKKLTKEHINSRGYNKYLILKNTVNIEIDYEKFKSDVKWDGLKGYKTNTDLNVKKVIENYSNLWQIEKAFRISKTDLKIRPIYHRLKDRIDAHICISFSAYAIYKELERILMENKAPFSISEAIEMSKHIYQIRTDKKNYNLKLDKNQKKLINFILNT